MTQLLVLSAVALMGFAIQRGTLCTVLAAQQLLDHGRWQRLAALLLAGAVAALVTGSWALGGGAASTPAGWVAGWGTVIGGVLFGIGATLNDGCTLGTVAKLARGQIGFVAVVPGFVVGAWIGAETSLLTPGAATSLHTPDEAFGPSMTLVLAFAILVIGLWLVLRWRHPLRDTPWMTWRGSWSVDAAMLVLGLAAGVLLLLEQGWSYLTVLGKLAIHRTMPGGLEIAMFVVLFLGGFVAARAAGQLRWVAPTPWRLAGHAAGGVLMGLGATLLPGGNDALILSGMPFLFFHAWIGFVAIVLTILASLAVSRLMRSNRPTVAGEDVAGVGEDTSSGRDHG